MGKKLILIKLKTNQELIGTLVGTDKERKTLSLENIRFIDYTPVTIEGEVSMQCKLIPFSPIAFDSTWAIDSDMLFATLLDDIPTQLQKMYELDTTTLELPTSGV